MKKKKLNLNSIYYLINVSKFIYLSGENKIKKKN